MHANRKGGGKAGQRERLLGFRKSGEINSVQRLVLSYFLEQSELSIIPFLLPAGEKKTFCEADNFAF